MSYCCYWERSRQKTTINFAIALAMAPGRPYIIGTPGLTGKSRKIEDYSSTKDPRTQANVMG